MNTPRSGSLLDEIFDSPQWKSRASQLLRAAFGILVIARSIETLKMVISGSFRVGELYSAFIYTIKSSVVDVLFWVLLPYLFYMLAERRILRANLSPIQTRDRKILAVVGSVAGGILLIYLFPSY